MAKLIRMTPVGHPTPSYLVIAFGDPVGRVTRYEVADRDVSRRRFTRRFWLADFDQKQERGFSTRGDAVDRVLSHFFPGQVEDPASQDSGEGDR